jgi:hypothetical protein
LAVAATVLCKKPSDFVDFDAAIVERIDMQARTVTLTVQLPLSPRLTSGTVVLISFCLLHFETILTACRLD